MLHSPILSLPGEKLRMVASLRYDLFHYNFDNNLNHPLLAAHRTPLTILAELVPRLGLPTTFRKERVLCQL